MAATHHRRREGTVTTGGLRPSATGQKCATSYAHQSTPHIREKVGGGVPTAVADALQAVLRVSAHFWALFVLDRDDGSLRL